jgi:hypothetical protein
LIETEPSDLNAREDFGLDGRCPKCGAVVRIYRGENRVESHVQGIRADEVALVVGAIMGEATRASPIISNSVIGVLNTGEIKDVQSIAINVSNLEGSGHAEIANALRQLTEVVASSGEITSSQRSKALEILGDLGKQATAPKEARASAGTMETIIAGLASIISVGGEFD